MMNNAELMQKDKDLHQLFRARLPIASLPKDFADRLTKAILDEVAHLRQSTPLSTHWSDNHSDNPGEFQVSGSKFQVPGNLELWNLKP